MPPVIKKICCFFAVGVLLAAFRAVSSAQAAAESYYVEVWNMMDGRTRDLLNELGIDENDVESVLGIGADGVIDMLKRIFSLDIRQVAESFLSLSAITALAALLLSFCNDGKTKELCEITAAAVIMFALSARVSQAVSSCSSAIALTSGFIKSLLPVFCAVVSFSGNAASALSLNGVVLAYSQTASAVFSSLLPSAALFGTSLACADAVYPASGCGRVSRLFNRAVICVSGFVSGIFVAVLSVKNVVAGAADTVAARGLRFFVSNSIPVVGSAIGDALGSVISSLRLIRTGVGVLGVLAVALINLFPLCSLIQWRISLVFLSYTASVFGSERVSGFVNALGSLLSVMTAVLCFNCVVYIISLAAVISVRS